MAIKKKKKKPHRGFGRKLRDTRVDLEVPFSVYILIEVL